MAAHVVWIDAQTAKIFRLVAPKAVITQLHRSGTGHGPQGHHGKHPELEHFFHEVAGQLGGASEILVLGPGEAKAQFKHHLEKHHHAAIANKIVGVETVDHPTDAQIIAKAKTFFRSYDLWDAI